MTYSVLFKNSKDRLRNELTEAPAFFADLNLHQIIDASTADKQEYNLKPFFYTPLSNIQAIQYRQEIMQELENKILRAYIKSFAQKIRTMRRYLSLVDKLDYTYHKEGWFLEAVIIYCDAVNSLLQDLNSLALKSRGLLRLRDYMLSYVNSDPFNLLLEETKKLKADLSTVRYCVLINGNCVKVCRYQSEIDYSAEVEKTFKKFQQGAVKDYRVEIPTGIGMNHVEAQILNLVAKLFPEIFTNLRDYVVKHRNFLDDTVITFDREIQFYIAYLEYIETLKPAQLKFCYPRISNTGKEVYDYEGFDLALAYKLIRENKSIVCNDFYLRDPERIIVVSGPNQGGKTTFARTFGQVHFLASLGCPVPGREAQLFLFDNLFTHFEKEENIKNLRGKLQDDLIRIREILNHATSNSSIIMNEIFTSTTLQDEVFLSKKVMEKIIQLDLLCIWVTFIDELASFSEKTVSMVRTVVPENPALRTYKIVRKPATGLSYAMAIAEKYGLTYNHLKERIKR